jgi:hypothetical protein
MIMDKFQIVRIQYKIKIKVKLNFGLKMGKLKRFPIGTMDYKMVYTNCIMKMAH